MSEKASEPGFGYRENFFDYRHLVAAFILRMTGVAFDPLIVHLVAVDLGEELFPEIGIERLILIVAHPAVGLPLTRPAFGDRVDHVLGVADEGDVAAVFERRKAVDNAEKLHPVVGGICLPAGQLFFIAVTFEDRAPAAGAGISRACAVGIEFYFTKLFQLMAPFFCCRRGVFPAARSFPAR